MEYEQQSPNDGFLNRMKESPRTVSAIIIVVIVAAAIYAFSGNNQNQQPAQGTPTTSPSSSPTASSSPATSPSSSTNPTAKPGTTPQAAKPAAENRKTDSAYVVVAEKGDGLTHLARRATSSYLADNNVGYTVTKEHRIYMEDYIRKHMAKTGVKVGSEHTISFDLVKQAVEAAQKLNERQLKNLTKYSHVLP